MSRIVIFIFKRNAGTLTPFSYLVKIEYSWILVHFFATVTAVL
jgi:hypothetical protein